MSRLDHPALLALAAAALPLLVIGWRSLRALDPVRRTLALGLRALLALVLAFMLASPHTQREHDQLTVIGLLDISGSVRRFADVPAIDEEPSGVSSVESLRRWFLAASSTRAPDDRFGLVVFDGQAAAFTVPSRRGGREEDTIDLEMIEGTNIADALRLGMAIFPPGTARRLVLASDGNETMGDALAAAAQAAGGRGAARSAVPIDVLPIHYEIASDVQVVRAEAPPSASTGQTITVRVVLDASAPASGRLVLRREGQVVDLNGAAAGHSRPLTLPAGRSVHLAQVVLGDSPVNRFEAVFEPDDAAADEVIENNRAEAFTATPARGKVLIVDEDAGASRNWLGEVLTAAALPVEVRRPGAMPAELLELQRYDLIILDNVPAWSIDQASQADLARYVHDLGGGLIMVGGPRSFGAGGWNGSPLEAILPLEMNPPREMILPTAALVLVIDKSGSMQRTVAGARASQQQIANESAALAIESLRVDSLVGVVTFDSGAHVPVPLQRNVDPQTMAGRVRGIVANGGTDVRPALRKAHALLREVQVDRKRVVCLSDGESPTDGLDAIVQAMAGDGIVLTTIAVGDEADEETLRRLATLGGGEFHAVRNPRQLPRVLVDSVQIINKPLLKESPFVPRVRPTGSSLTVGMDAAPALGGLVITAPRDEETVVIEMTHPDGEVLLAHWQAGIGRAAAYTSDAEGHWSQEWLAWPGAPAFFVQLARLMARPAADLKAELLATIDGERLDIVLEAGDPGDLPDYLVVEGAVYTPQGDSVPVRLRQTGPGRYEGSARAVTAGNYVVALSPRQGSRRLSPAIGGTSKTSSPEYRRSESNLALLESIRARTGGRTLDLSNPRGADLFDRSAMAPSVSSLPAWRPLLWLAIGLFLLDAACRRIAWDARQVRAAVARALARVAPASIRGRAAEATLAALRQASAPVDRRVERAEGAFGVADEGASEMSPAPASAQPRAAAPPAAELPPQPHKQRPPDARQVAAALAALLGKPSDEAKPPADSDAKAAEPAPEVTTQSLLAAKRRARRG